MSGHSPLAEVVTYISRGLSPRYDKNGYIILNQRCIRDHRIEFETARVTTRTRIKPEKFIQQWDVLVNSTGVGTLGRVAQVCKLVENVAVDSHVTIVRPDLDKLDGCYFGYALIYREDYIKTLGAGATGQTELSQQRLSEVVIPIPPLPIQHKIATILSAYDDLIENNLCRIKILEEIAQTIYREWFVNFRFPGHESVQMIDSTLGKIPEGWEARTLGEVTSLIKRGVSPIYDCLSPSIVINQKCIRNSRLDLSQSRQHRNKVPEEKYVVRGDILINSTGVGTLGRVAQVQVDIPDCTVDSHVTVVRPAREEDPEFFGLQLLKLEPYFMGQGRGTTGQAELGKDVISNARYIQPPKKLQAHFGELVRPSRTLSIQLDIKNNLLRHTRDLLLPKLISGEIDVSSLDISAGGDPL
jgi:type I restriction enzyme S subunit